MKRVFCALIVLLGVAVSGFSNEFELGPYFFEQSDEAVIDFLRQNLPDIDNFKVEKTPLLISAVMSGNYRVTEFILKNGGDPDIAMGSEQTALHFASHHLPIVKLLLNYGADPNAGKDYGRPLLEWVLTLTGKYDEKEYKHLYDTARYLAEISEFSETDMEQLIDAYKFRIGKPRETMGKLTPEDEVHLHALIRQIGLRIK